MKNVKTVSILCIILIVVVIAGFVFLTLRKQAAVTNGTLSEIKSYFGKSPKLPVDPAVDKAKLAYEGADTEV